MNQPRIFKDILDLESKSSLHTQSILSLQETVSDMQSQLLTAFVPVTVSNLSIGEEVYLPEGDIHVPFIVVEKDYLISGNVVLMRKYPLREDYLGTAVAGYLGSYLDNYLENDYKGILMTEYSPITLPASNQNGTSTSGSRSIFIPSYMELTGNTTTVSGRSVSEGNRFTYFVRGNSVICTLNGVGVNYFLRTPYDLSNFYIVTSSGGYSFSASRDDQYIRPCVSVKNTTNAYRKVYNDPSNVLAEAVVSG